MTILDRIRSQLRTLLVGPPAAAANYWRAINDVLANREPKADVLASVMRELQKSDVDFEQDVAAVAALQAAEAQHEVAAEAYRGMPALRRSTKQAWAEVDRLTAELERARQAALAAEHQARAVEAALESARTELDRQRRSLALRGHPASLDLVNKADAANLQQGRADAVEHALATARREVEDLEQRLAVIDSRPDRAPTEGDAFRAALPARRARVAELEQRLAALRQPAASPAP